MPRNRIRLKDLKAQAAATLANANEEMDSAGALFASVIKEVLDGVVISVVDQETKKKFRFGISIDLLEGNEEGES